MANACIFCGRTDRTITKEHIFAEWVDRLFPDAASQKGLSVLIKSDGSEKPYITFPFEQTVRVVCDRCNNEWMSLLERTVAPILGPMVRDGCWTRLTPTVQRTIATWALKTALILQYLHPADRRIPDAEYQSFYVQQQPLPGSVIWIGHRAEIHDFKTGLPLITAARSQLIERVYREGPTPEEVQAHVEQGSRVYRVTFMLGHVVLVVLGHTFPGSMKFAISSPLARVIQCIWPVQRRTTWPPPETVDSMGGLDALHKAFDPPPDALA